MNETNIVNNKTNLLSAAGSFWRNMLRDKTDVQRIRRFARVTDVSDFLLTPDKLGSLLSGEQFEDVNNVVLDITNKTGSHSAEWSRRYLDAENNPTRPIHDSVTDAGLIQYSLSDERNVTFREGGFMSFPFETNLEWKDVRSVEPMFYILCEDVYPISIRTETGVLIVGVNFEIHYDRIILREDPSVLFPASKMFLIAGKRRTMDTQSYVHGVQELKQSGHFVSRYLRGQTSAKTLELALNEVAELTIVPKKFQVAYRTTFDEKGTVYKSVNGDELHILQPHTTKEAGEVFEENEVPGKAVECNCYSKDGAYWWRKVNWSPFVEVKGVTGIFDVRFYNTFIQLRRGGNFVSILARGNDMEAWNSFREDQEIKFDTNFSSKLIEEYSLADGGEVTINDLDFIMEKILTTNAMVVTIYETKVFPNNRKNLYDFLDNNKPTGTVVILNIWPESN